MVVCSSSPPLPLRKRKRTVDMPESPPKRVTRARTKATVESEATLKTTKITTASTRIAAESKTPVKPVRIAKRRTRAEDAKEEMTQEPKALTSAAAVMCTTRGRPRRIVEEVHREEKDFQKEDEPPRTRNRRGTDNVDAAKEVTAKPKGKAKKAAREGSDTQPGKGSRFNQLEPPKKTIRGRAAVADAKLSTSQITRPVTVRKKVTFQDENKENRDLRTTTEKDNKSRPTGIRAKPIRKPPIMRATRSKIESELKASVEGKAVENQINFPLSPKKTKQVAKTNSISSEDELSGERIPIRALSKSPVKAPINGLREVSQSASKIDFVGPVLELTSQLKEPSSPVLATPARRPPPSPYKDALRDAPKSVSKADFMNSAFDLNSPTKTLSSTVLGSSARRLPPTPFKDALKESPKRSNLGSSVTRPIFAPQQPVFKATSLQSPARRPTSPLKSVASRSPEKLAREEIINIAMNVAQGKDALAADAIHVESSSLQARSPERPAKIPRTNPIEQRKMTVKSGNLEKDTAEEVEQPRLESLSAEDSCSTPSKLPKDTDNHISTTPPNTPIQIFEQLDVIAHNQALHAPGSDLGGREKPQPFANFEVRTISENGAFSLASHNVRLDADESDSEDELQSEKNLNEDPHGFTIKTSITKLEDLTTPAPTALTTQPTKREPIKHKDDCQHGFQNTSMTPLAMQLSSWLAASPDKKTPRKGREQGDIFSSTGSSFMSRAKRTRASFIGDSPLKSTFFDDEMAIRDQESESMEETQRCPDLEDFNEVDEVENIQDIEQYGDENAVPVDPQLFAANESCTGLLTCTPVRVSYQNPREIHTVSKVPLRPSDDDTPVHVPRKRSRSVSGPLTLVKPDSRQSRGPDSAVLLPSNDEPPYKEEADPHNLFNAVSPIVRAAETPLTPEYKTWSEAGTPKTIRIGPDAEILRGAVVHVDVHTTEGADASAIFVELLTQMGARCVKQWSWNSRTSLNDSSENTTLSEKVGITHVIFKDGGKRTLEKVRESKGLVLCVGVGWVLE